MITIEVHDAEVKAAFDRLLAVTSNPKPALRLIGETLVGTTKARFASSKAPDGTPWKTNSRVVYEALLSRTRGNFTKGGKLAARGAARVMGKKPLIGESKALSTTITYQVVADGVIIGSPKIYAATQQFGAAMGAFGRYYQLFRLKYDKKDFRRHAGSKKGHPIPWGNIPPRPFLGVSEEDKGHILAILRDALEAATK
jgi:phage gpG-like protein